MTDMKSALARVLNEWEGKADNAAPQPQATSAKPTVHLFKPTNGVTRATFEVVRANPGITRPQAYRLLEKQGYKLGSTASLITAFIRHGQMEMVGDRVFVTRSEYTPLKSSSGLKKQAKAKPVAKAKAKPVKPAPQPQVQEAPRTALITHGFSVDKILQNLTILQAKALRDALNNLFK